MLKKHGKTNKLSQPIVFLAVIGIALGIAVMLISSAVATGFQKEIREKVIGFGGHIQIESQFGNESYESNPMLIPYNLKDELEKIQKLGLLKIMPTSQQYFNLKMVKNSITKGKSLEILKGLFLKQLIIILILLFS